MLKLFDLKSQSLEDPHIEFCPQNGLEKFASVNFFNEFSFGTTGGPEMLVKYAILVKIQPIAPDKRVRPKASNLLVNLIEPLSLK